jgi:membrane-associated phospholipid phosphatase
VGWIYPVFRSKHEYKLLWPATYIREIDPVWLPYITTPNHPEYPAAHAYITSAAMAGAASAIGNNHVITDHTYDFVGYSPRSFTTLLAVGEESGISRLYGGIHYPQSINTGVLYGQKAGNDVGTLKMWK